MFVGRERELVEIEALLDGARSGSGGVLAVVGDIGIGKSELLGEAVARAEGMTVLRARGVESEAKVPFAGLLEIVRPVLDHLSDVPAPQRAALEAALAMRPPSGDERFAVGAATLSLLAAAAEDGPLLVVADDAHWIDGSTADALRFAMRRLFADPIAVLLGVRRGEPSLIDGTDLPTLELDGLDLAAATALLGGRGVNVGRQATARLHEHTQGNPLALVELAATTAWADVTAALDVPAPVSTSVAQAYLDRAKELPTRTATALLATAADDRGDLTELAAVLRALDVNVGDLEPAESVGLVRIEHGAVEFCHPLARAAIYADALPVDRRHAHGAIAAALPDADFDRRAWHAALATIGPDDAASSALEQAATHARDRGAHEVAATTYERASQLAVEEATSARLLQAAAEAAWVAGDSTRAVALLDRLDDTAAPETVQTAIDELRGRVAMRLGPVDVGRQILLTGADRAANGDPDRAILLLAQAVYAAFFAADPTGMLDGAHRLARLTPQATSDRARSFSDMAQGMAHIFAGDGDHGAALMREAVALIDVSDALGDDPNLLAWVAMGPLWLRESGPGDAFVAQIVEVARRRSVVGVLPFVLCHVAIAQAASSSWAEADAALHEAVELARETDQRTDLAAALARLSWLEGRQGHVASARRDAAEALQLSRSIGAALFEIWTLSGMAELELCLGHAADAYDRLQELDRRLAERGITDADISPATDLVDACLRLGRNEEAAAYRDLACEQAAAKRQPWALARAARCDGLIADADRFDEAFTLALVHHAQTPDLFETARTRLAYGQRLRRARRRVDARARLRRAIEDFDRLGATAWSNVARQELEATGETARRRDPSTLTQLSPRERQIASLLASGSTTRETAAALFLSPKTVEFHLRSAYRKLGINTRDDLAAALGQHRGPGPT